jgi:superfamily I DNA/RNA helicase
LKQHISRIFNHWFPQKKGGGPGSDGVRALVDLIGHSWQFRSPLRESIIAEVRQTDEYTEQQFMLLDHLQRFRRLLVCGCAGSGKTFLAVEKARRLKQEGFSVVLICWNENLAKWLQKRLHPMDIEVNHFNQFARSVIQRARNLGADIPPRYFPTMDDLLHSFLAGVERYDAIIVDEGQDFDKYPWRFVMKMLREDGILYIFYDDNQRVYRKHGRFPIQGPPVVLTTNCRNTKEIHDLAGRFYASDHPTTCLLKSGRQPELIVCEPDERTAMARVLDKLVNKENIEPEQIVILTPLADPNTQWEDGTRVGTFEIVRSLFKPGASNRSIRCSTIGAFKGLEREVVILAELDKSPKLHKNHMLYVGLSRARSHLIVLLRKEENRKWFKELLR